MLQRAQAGESIEKKLEWLYFRTSLEWLYYRTRSPVPLIKGRLGGRSPACSTSPLCDDDEIYDDDDTDDDDNEKSCMK